MFLVFVHSPHTTHCGRREMIINNVHSRAKEHVRVEECVRQCGDGVYIGESDCSTMGGGGGLLPHSISLLHVDNPGMLLRKSLTKRIFIALHSGPLHNHCGPGYMGWGRGPAQWAVQIVY